MNLLIQWESMEFFSWIGIFAGLRGVQAHERSCSEKRFKIEKN